MPSARVAILGAGGFVSQRMQQRLANHPWFDLVAVAGQDSGRMLTTVPWRLKHRRPEALNNISETILDVHSPELHRSLKSLGVSIVFSALPSSPAHAIEALLSRNGLVVFSNSSAYRMHPEAPLVVADVNPESLKQWPGELGLLACATNCTLIPVLHPLHVIANHHRIVRVKVRSEQALSGAGWTLLLDEEKRKAAIGNEIEGEAEKIIEEAERILRINAEWDVGCKRVDAEEGHIFTVDLEPEQNATYHEIKTLLFSQASNPLDHPSTDPISPTIVLDESPP